MLLNVCIYVCIYNIYKGLCQSRLSTTNLALLLIAPATTAVYSLERSYAWPPPSLSLRCIPYKPLCTDQVQNTVSNNYSIVTCVFLAAGTCFPIRCLETVCTTPLFIRLSSGHCTATAVRGAICFITNFAYPIHAFLAPETVICGFDI
jgi:hypothetical protein